MAIGGCLCYEFVLLSLVIWTDSNDLPTSSVAVLTWTDDEQTLNDTRVACTNANGAVTVIDVVMQSEKQISAWVPTDDYGWSMNATFFVPPSVTNLAIASLNEVGRRSLLHPQEGLDYIRALCPSLLEWDLPRAFCPTASR